MTIPIFLVDPDSKLNWEHNWNLFLAEGETISSRVWTISPMNPGSPQTPVLTNQTSSVVTVEGLLDGRSYYLTEEVVTSNGVRDQKTIELVAGHT